MALKKKSPPVQRDILKEKQEAISRLARKSDAAVNMVTRTISDLGTVNQEITDALKDIEDYVSSLEKEKVEMSALHDTNSAIISNFSKLLTVGDN